MANPTKSINTLYLNENPLPPTFTKANLAGKEQRLRAALPYVNHIHIIAASGPSVVKPGKKNQTRGPLERKISTQLLPRWPYYLMAVPLFIAGCVHCLKQRPNLIEAESPHISGPAAILLGKIFRIPVIIEYRSSFEQLIKQRFQFIPISIKQKVLDAIIWPVLHTATAVIANSAAYQHFLSSHGVISTPINPGIQYPPRNKVSAKRLNTPITIGYLGRLAPEKGAMILIKAFQLLLKDPTAPPVTLKLAGEGRAQDSFKAYVTKHNLQKYISFLGFQENYKFLKQIHILVNPNTVKASLEMANAEAAYMGVPVICFGNSEIPETVVHNHTGIKVKIETPQALAVCLKELINNPSKYTEYSKNAIKFAHDKYQFQSQVDTLDKLYKTLNL